MKTRKRISERSEEDDGILLLWPPAVKKKKKPSWRGFHSSTTAAAALLRLAGGTHFLFFVTPRAEEDNRELCRRPGSLARATTIYQVRNRICRFAQNRARRFSCSSRRLLLVGAGSREASTTLIAWPAERRAAPCPASAWYAFPAAATCIGVMMTQQSLAHSASPRT